MDLTYKLSPQQSEFFKSASMFPAYGGGWGNGKTLVGCLKAYDICSRYGDSRFMIGRQNFTDLRDSTLNDFLELYGSGDGYGTYHAGEMKYVLPNGSEILFRHLSNLQSLTNLNLSGGWIDQAEEVSEDSFLFLRGRMRRKSVPKRQLMATFNMEGHNWIYHYWKITTDKDFHLIEADTYANKKHLPGDYLESLEKLPTELYNRYVKGSWDIFEGQIYSEFDENIHVIQPVEIQKHWKMFEGLDVGIRHPTAYVQGFEDENGNLYFAKCFRKSDPKAHEIADIIFDMRDDRVPETTVIDPSSGKREQTSGENIRQQLSECEIHTSKANNDVMAGISRVKKWLTQKKIFIFNTCTELIEELRQYQWEKPKTIKGVVLHNERPLKVNDDLVDSMRYLCMSRPDHFEVRKPSPIPEKLESAYTLKDIERQIEEKQMQEDLEHFL